MALQGNFVGSVRSLTAALSAAASPKVTAAAMLLEVDEGGRPVVRGTRVEALRFQYFPDSLTSEKAPEVPSKSVPGGNLPLKDPQGAGDHTLTFTAYFSCDLDLVELLRNLGSPRAVREHLESIGQARMNVDLRAAHAWLRRYTLMSYRAADRGTIRTVPLRKVRLYIPNSGIGALGGMVDEGSPLDSVTCLLTGCTINITSFFPSGLPRTSEVSLTFSEVCQINGTIRFPHADPLDSLVKGTDRVMGYHLTGTGVVS